jgi:hypothetical protein
MAMSGSAYVRYDPPARRSNCARRLLWKSSPARRTEHQSQLAGARRTAGNPEPNARARG